MADSQKEDTTTAKTKKKSSISDEFGDDFLSSWKPMSVSEDDGLDFNQEAVPKGKKKAFNFDKLDMDFSLDGDFGKKISSFNVDMSDLDFSSPLKKPSKPKEKNTEESSSGKQGGKQSRFSFDFDFNELDSFDFGSNLLKGENKSDKAADLKGFDSPGKPEKVQTAKSKPVESISLPGDSSDFDSSLYNGQNKSGKAADLKEYDSPGIQEKFQVATNKTVKRLALSEDSDTGKRPTSQDANALKFEHSKGDAGKSDAVNDSPSTSANFGNLSPLLSKEPSPEKELAISAKATGQSSQHSERTVSTEPNAQKATQGSSIRSASMEGSVQEATPDTQGEVCSSATEEMTIPEEPLDISMKLCNPEPLPSTNIPVLTMKNECNKMLINQSNVHMTDKPSSESMQDDTTNDGADQDCAQKMLQSARPAAENSGKSKLLLAPLSSEPVVHQPTKEKGSGSIQTTYVNRPVEIESQSFTHSIPKQVCSVSNEKVENAVSNSINARSQSKTHQSMKEKGSYNLQSKYFSKSVETEPQLDSQSVPKKISSISNKKTENVLSIPADPRRQESVANNVQAANQKVDNSKSHEKTVTKGISIKPGNEKSDENRDSSSSFQVRPTRLLEQAVKSPSPQSLNSKLVSSIAAIRNSKSNSLEVNKLSSLHAAKKTPEASPLKVTRLLTINDASHSKSLKEIKPLRHSQQSTAVHCTSAKIDHTASVAKQNLLSPSLKRKMSEELNTGQTTLPPLKRQQASPIGYRQSQEASEMLDKKKIHISQNLSTGLQSSPKLDVSRDESWKEAGALLLIENDGIVEKAEACAKELDDICNMLKKKNEEAKELLVRALVNNNNLLMLNHPIYEEKIRMVQQFASRMSPECKS